MQNNSSLVVDVNVVISALMGRGDSLEAFVQNFKKEKFRLITPYFLLIELSKYTEKIMKKTKFPSQELYEIADFISNQIVLIDESEFGGEIKKSKEILGEHYKDAPYVALAFANNCYLFSGDKTLKSIIPNKVKNPREILNLIK